MCMVESGIKHYNPNPSHHSVSITIFSSVFPWQLSRQYFHHNCLISIPMTIVSSVFPSQFSHQCSHHNCLISIPITIVSSVFPWLKIIGKSKFKFLYGLCYLQKFTVLYTLHYLAYFHFIKKPVEKLFSAVINYKFDQ